MSSGPIYIDLRGLRTLKVGLDEIAEWKFPYAVKGTLNDMAMQMKGNRGSSGGIEKRARKGFKYARNKTFIRSLTWAELEKGKKGTKVESMRSGAGIVEINNKNRAAEGLARQQTASPVEHGFTPLPEARVGGNESRNVSSSARHKRLNYVDLTKFRPNKRVRGMVLAHKTKRPIYFESKKGNRLIARPIGNKLIVRDREENTIKIPMKILYYRNPHKTARLSRRVPFVDQAGDDALKNFNKYFYKNFDRYFK